MKYARGNHLKSSLYARERDAHRAQPVGKVNARRELRREGRIIDAPRNVNLRELPKRRFREVLTGSSRSIFIPRVDREFRFFPFRCDPRFFPFPHADFNSILVSHRVVARKYELFYISYVPFCSSILNIYRANGDIQTIDMQRATRGRGITREHARICRAIRSRETSRVSITVFTVSSSAEGSESSVVILFDSRAFPLDISHVYPLVTGFEGPPTWRVAI